MLSNSYYATRNRTPHRLHSILVDTQPKVIKPFLEKKPKWLDPANVKYFEHGRGNNWSYGYLHEIPSIRYHQQYLPKYKQYSHKQSAFKVLNRYITQNKLICEYVLDRVRHQLETVDCAMCINVLGSLGGGTGSGLGTKIIQKMGEQFSIDIYSHLVLPNKSGQTPLQAYNCVLSLNTIQQYSEIVFTYENDKLMTLFEGKQKSASLEDINQHISSALSQFIKINDLPDYDNFYTNIAGQCKVSEQLKYLNLFGVHAKDWEKLFPQLYTQVKNYQHDQYKGQFVQHNHSEKLIHGELLLLGKQQPPFQQTYSKKFKNIVQPYFEESLNVEFHKCKGTHRNFLIKEEQSQPKGQRVEAIYLSNHSSISHYLGYLYQSALIKYEARAYLWHYQYANLEEAINSVRTTYDQYVTFVKN